ncbi:MAG: hypothetical protein ACLUE2_09425 [Bacteroides cellulosilyticus]
MLGITAIVEVQQFIISCYTTAGIISPIYTNAFSTDCPYRKERNKPNMTKQNNPAGQKETPILHQCAGRFKPYAFPTILCKKNERDNPHA